MAMEADEEYEKRVEFMIENVWSKILPNNHLKRSPTWTDPLLHREAVTESGVVVVVVVVVSARARL